MGTLVELLRGRAAEPNDEPAVTFLLDGEEAEVSLSYAALDERARAIAARLVEMGAPGKQALLLFPPGLDYIAAFFGCLYAGAVAVPVYPPDPSRLARTLPRLQAIAADSRAEIVLTTSPLLSLGEALFAMAPDLARLSWLASDSVPLDAATAWREPAARPETLAFLQYTSGSTGTPKGVMLSHANLLSNEAMIADGFRLDRSSKVLGWLPLYHDMGLIGNLLQPIFVGCPTVLMSPLDFLAKPMRWLRAISRYRATTSGGPNFAYDLCVRKSTAAERASIDLGPWSLAFTGAEPVRKATLDRFVETFAPSGFRRAALYPCYGLAESSLIVTGARSSRDPVTRSFDPAALESRRAVARIDGVPLVSCGSALLDSKLVVVDPATRRPCDPGSIGEIWTRSGSVARGYFGKPELSAETFEARLDTGEGPFLRTGDLGFLDGDELYVTGRLKDLIIIRGRNLYPQDIELTVERADARLRPGCGAAFAVERAGEEQLIVVHELDRRSGDVDSAEVILRIQQAIVENHEVRAHEIALVETGSISKTSSGKIQRSACRAAWLDGTLARVPDLPGAPRTR